MSKYSRAIQVSIVRSKIWTAKAMRSIKGEWRNGDRRKRFSLETMIAKFARKGH